MYIAMVSISPLSCSVGPLIIPNTSQIHAIAGFNTNNNHSSRHPPTQEIGLMCCGNTLPELKEVFLGLEILPVL